MLLNRLYYRKSMYLWIREMVNNVINIKVNGYNIKKI